MKGARSPKVRRKERVAERRPFERAVNAQIVDASGGARKEHGIDEQIFVTQDEGSVFEDTGA